MTVDRVHELMDRADEMPYGAAKTMVVEEAVRTADAAGDADLAFAARMELVNAYQYGAEPGKSFVPFSWCLAAYDADPRRHASHTETLLWFFKYMISNLTRFPEIPLDRTYAVLDDMERRWRAGGHSLHAVHRYRELVAAHVGDAETEVEQFRLWSAAPRDSLSDCIGCDPTGKVYHLTRHERFDEAVALAVPVLSGRLSCREQPQQILTSLLPAYVQTGRYAEAADAHRRAYRVLRGDRGELDSVADHLLFCARTGNEVRALELVERHLGWLDNPPSPRAEMFFAAAAALSLRLVDAGLMVRRRGHPDVPAAALADELAERAEAIAARFDERNGSPQQSQLVAQTLAARPWVDYLPLSETARRVAQRRASAPTRPAEPVPAPPIDPALTGDALLDLAEERWRARDTAGAEAAWDAFAGRVPETGRTPLQAARLLDARGLRGVNGNPRIALAAWREALAAYAELGQDDRVLRVRARLGTLLCQLGDVDEGLATGEEPLRRLVADGDAASRTSWGLMLATMLLTARRYTEALTAVDDAASTVDTSARPSIGADLRLVRADVLLALDRVAEAEAELRAVREAGEVEDSQRASAALRLADLLVRRDEMDAAADAYAEAIEHASGTMAIEARFRRGRLLSGGPRASEAVTDLVECVAEFTARSAVEGAALARVELAIAYLNTERFIEAAETAEEAVSALPGSGAAEMLPRARHVLATAYRELGEIDAALELIQASIAERPADSHHELAQLREEEGDLLEKADRDGEAVAVYEGAAAGFDTADSPIDRIRALRKAARSARYAERLDDAARLLDSVEAALVPLPSAEPAVAFHAAGLDFDRAMVAEQSGRPREAAMLAGRAAEGYETVGAGDNAADARVMQASLLDAATAEPVLRTVFDGVEPGSNLWYRAGYALADALRGLDRATEADDLEAILDDA